jgi:hypothetical protein
MTHQRTTHQDCPLNALLKPALPPASTAPALTLATNMPEPAYTPAPASHTPAAPWAVPNTPVASMPAIKWASNAPALTPASHTPAVPWARPNVPVASTPAMQWAVASRPELQWAPLPNA